MTRPSIGPLAALGFRSAGRFHAGLRQLQKRPAGEVRRLEELVEQISSRGDAVFKTPNEESRSLRFSFDLGNGQDASAAAAVTVLDPRLGEAKSRLVGEQLSEQDFFFNYFSHVVALLNAVFNQDEQDAMLIELKSSIRALIHVEDCASLMALLPWFCYGFGPPIVEQEALPLRGPENFQQLHNRALHLLGPVFARFPCSKADVITVAACIAVEELGGPKVAWRHGRVDEDESDAYVDVRAHFSASELSALRWLAVCLKSVDSDISQQTSPSSATSSSSSNGSKPKANVSVLTSNKPNQFGSNFFVDWLDSEETLTCPDHLLSWIELYAVDNTRFCQEFCAAFTKLHEYKFQFDAHTVVRTPSNRQQETTPLAFVLPKELKIFGFRAIQALPPTQEWREAALSQAPKIISEVVALTMRKPHSPKTTPSASPTGGGGSCVDISVFRSMHPKTPADFSFDLNNEDDQQAAIVAGIVDPVVNKFKPSLVPKIPETDFYRNYMSHVFQIYLKWSHQSKRTKSDTIKVFVGSKNPVKINACKRAFLAAFRSQGQVFEFHGVSAPSGVSDQPMGDEETRTGAINRAQHCKDTCASSQVVQEYYVGLEGGLMEDAQENLICMAWMAVISNDGQISTSRTATFLIPPTMASLVHKGIELGHADDIVHGTINQKQKWGTVGTLTRGEIDRTRYYEHAVILALAPFANSSLYV